jgi:hypothetical protein
MDCAQHICAAQLSGLRTIAERRARIAMETENILSTLELQTSSGHIQGRPVATAAAHFV